MSMEKLKQVLAGSSDNYLSLSGDELYAACEGLPVGNPLVADMRAMGSKAGERTVSIHRKAHADRLVALAESLKAPPPAAPTEPVATPEPAAVAPPATPPAEPVPAATPAEPPPPSAA